MTNGADTVVRAQTAGNLAWIDLEMTGLDPDRDVILQAALIVTNAELVPLEQFVCDIWQPARALEQMTPFVRKMHEETGLLRRVERATTELSAAERYLLERIAGWCPYPATLCGNSVGQDKRFIERWMPGLAGYLNYRIIDVTTLKLLARAWYGEQAVYSKPAEGAHDALVDIKNSIAELAHYRKTLFR
jgi:oligoribonuclease